MTNKNLPEITLKSVVLSILLIILLTASNVYLGLKAGTTISTSIPAVVISLAILRLFRKYNVLEINTIQTASSVADGAVSGIIFTIPALMIIHFWQGFNYWDTVIIGFLGGVLGIIISIPIKTALLKEKNLHFPEGMAIGQVIKIGVEGGGDIKPIAFGGLAGALIVLFSSGFRIIAQTFLYWIIKGKMLFGFGFDFSPALIAAGYICGINLAIGIIVGVTLIWIIGLPFLTMHFGLPHLMDPANIANSFWANYIRYIGIGTMLMGGIWTLIRLLKPITEAIQASFHSLAHIRAGHGHKIASTERDIPINYIIWGLIIVCSAIAIKLATILLPNTLGIPFSMRIVTLLICVVYLFIVSFIVSAIGGYFAGLVGASNSPLSGLILSGLLLFALLILTIVGASQIHHHLQQAQALAACGLVVIITAFIGTAVTSACEVAQVSKVGAIVNATPWKQQIILIIGTGIAAFIVPLILQLLFNAYGMAGVFPRSGMPTAQMLPAPQAGLVAAVSQAVFTHQIPWPMLGIGILIAIFCITIDEFLKKHYKKRLIVLAVGLGIYLPMNLTIALAVGGFLSYLIQRFHVKSGAMEKTEHIAHETKGMHNALFLACGLVAGSTIMGVVLAIPFAIYKNSDILRIIPESFDKISWIFSFIVTAALCYWIYKVGIKVHNEDKK